MHISKVLFLSHRTHCKRFLLTIVILIYLISFHSFSNRFDVMLNRQIHKFILCFSLNQTRTLRPHHLYSPLNINLTVQTYWLNSIHIKTQQDLLTLKHIPYFFNWSRIMSITIKVPVLPIPAEQWTSMAPGGFELGSSCWRASCRLFTSCRKLSTQPGSEGTPWSGHA